MMRFLTSLNVFRNPMTTLMTNYVAGLCSVRCAVLYRLNNLLIQKKKKIVAPIAKREDFVNLTSFSIEVETLPKEWPLATMLRNSSSPSSSPLSIEAEGHGQTNHNCTIQVF